jgi:hypothetical protein
VELSYGAPKSHLSRRWRIEYYFSANFLELSVKHKGPLGGLNISELHENDFSEQAAVVCEQIHSSMDLYQGCSHNLEFYILVFMNFGHYPLNNYFSYVA